MEARELRIGNYVTDIHASEKFAAKVNQINNRYIHYGAYKSRPEDVKPIPLTEDWLLKFGYKYEDVFENKMMLPGDHSGDMDGARGFKHENGSRIYIDKDGNFCYEIALNSDDYGFIVDYKVLEYVHNLQNLHYALEKEELTISE